MPAPPDVGDSHDLLAEANAAGVAARDLARDLPRSPFSGPAFDAIQVSIAEYITELVSRSGDLARREEADLISAKHVNRASTFLNQSSGKNSLRHVGTIGGILAGAGISQVVTMVSVAQYTTTGVLIAVCLEIVGWFMVALHIARD